MAIGVLGGAFNPIHIGHLNAASEVAELVGLDRVFFVVSARPPHKEPETLIDSESRYRMVEIACEEDERFEPSRVELDRSGKSYTIDTMRDFQEKYGKEVYFIIGQDALTDISSWKAAATLLKTCNFIAVTRPGYDVSTLADVLQSVLSVRYRNLKIQSQGRSRKGKLATLSVVGGVGVIKVAYITPLDISSSVLRRRLIDNKSIRYLAPEGVWRYLVENKIGEKLAR